ncbi:uncharacterized protein LOC114462926 [Gouania willdenowi]|uniref:uncharacterized protein LOC114462926 n=1 Tax=Gouania willdenowi TaxID=441366 RepID=UPI001054F5A9|nr:uncharacterized protein LOC114462926 [Gouania willdenowi]
MKIVCVAVVALSLISGCCSAPLACEKLMKPIEGIPDVSGRWYIIGLSTSLCLPSTLINAVLWPSITVDFVSKGTPDLYKSTTNVKMYGFCHNETLPLLIKGNYMTEVDENDAPKGDSMSLLQTGCPDCFVATGNDFIHSLMIASRRKNITAAELDEFEMQAKCLSLSKPQYMNTDFDFEDCKSFDNTTDEEDIIILAKIHERVSSMCHLIIKCIIEAILYLFEKGTSVGWS